MPKIVEFTNPIKGLSPSNEGPDALARAGSAEKSFADQAGSAIAGGVSRLGGALQKRQQFQAQQEDANLTTALAAFENNSTDQCTDINNSDQGGTLQARQQYLDGLTANLDAIGAGLQTPQAKLRFAQERTRILQSAQKQTAGDIATRAADQASANVTNYVNSKVSLVSKDPTRLDDLLGTVDGDIPTLIPSGAKGAGYDKIITESSQQIKTAMVKTGLTAMARNNPTQFMQDWQSGKFDKYMGYLTPSDQSALPNVAATVQKANDRSAAAAANAKDKADRTAVEGAVVGQMAGLYNQDGSVNLQNVAAAHQFLAKTLPTMPGVTKADLNDLQGRLDKIESGQIKANKDDPTVIQDFESRMNDAQHPLTEADIWRAETDGHITTATRVSMLGEFKALHPTDKPGPLDNKVNNDQFNSQVNRLEPAPGSFGTKYLDTGDKLAAALAARDAYTSWYRQSFINGINAGYTPESLLFPGGEHYIDPRAWATGGGSDPDALLSAAQKYKTTTAPTLFNTPGVAPSVVAKPDNIHNADGTLKITIPGLVPGGK